MKVLGLLILVASLVVKHGLMGFSSCGSQALERSLNSLWHTGFSYLEHAGSSPSRVLAHVPAWADRLSTTRPPGSQIPIFS